MELQDDPEARIRELERPLVDTARASELGGSQPNSYTGPAGQSASPPPPPPHTYGGPFPDTSPRSRGGNRLWWILAALFVVGVLILVGGVSGFAAHLLQMPGAGPSTPPPGSNLSVSGYNKKQKIACNHSVVSVSGVSNTILITGHCARLTVSGVKNLVTVDAVDTIDASGLDNQVTYRSGKPIIDKSGDSNIVRQG